jgi:hypothetical protein
MKCIKFIEVWKNRDMTKLIIYSSRAYVHAKKGSNGLLHILLLNNEIKILIKRAKA